MLRAVRTNRTIRAAHVQWISERNKQETSSTLWKELQSNCYWTVFLDKLTVSLLVKESLIFYGVTVFITVFTTPRNLYLTWAISIRSTSSHSIFWISILIISSLPRLRLTIGPFQSSLPTKKNPCLHFCSPGERDHLEDLDVEWSTILKCFLMKYDVMWLWFIWHRIRASGGLLWGC